MTGQPAGLDSWATAPFAPALADEARRLIAKLDTNQRFWLSGYLAGISLAAGVEAPQPAAGAARLVTVLYGSQTGNAEGLARRLAEALQRRGIPCALLDMMDCRKAELLAARTLLVVVSTQGEGDPPDRALALWELLNSRKAPQLTGLRYSVLALGDSSYQNFCETGRQFDARLEALGATRMHPRVDCDVDFDTPAGQWMQAVIEKLAAAAAVEAGPSAAVGDTSVRVCASVDLRSAPASNAYTRKNPFHAEVLANQRLTARGSTKDVRHIELSLEGSSIHYEPGDALGVVPRNDAGDVDLLLSALKFDPEAPVELDSGTVSLRDALLERYDIGPLNRPFVERYARAVESEALAALLQPENESALEAYLGGRDVLDLVRDHPPRSMDANAFAHLLRPLSQRLYSIASSLRATPDEVHLTVSLVDYVAHGRRRRGVVSGMLAQLVSEGATVPVYLHRNPGFRLPGPDIPVVMVGPGTGVAPFRAFIAERAQLGASGRNWLFFGDRSFETDFLYQQEWLDLRKQGVLTRIDVAFSRDQTDKVYVQHRMRERGAELWAWLQQGAHFYVCGDAKRMAGDVHAALLDIVREHGGCSEEQAIEYVSQMQRERRYQRDVY
jgi:sulfite reductase (NADPH) flavoprotein alpha-component